MSNVIIPFGKYKGRSLKSVPLSMIGWLLTTYSGNGLFKKDIEEEALRRGCEKRNNKWGIERTRTYSNLSSSRINTIDSYIESDFLGNTIMATMKDLNDLENGEDEYEYEGIPNT